MTRRGPCAQVVRLHYAQACPTYIHDDAARVAWCLGALAYCQGQRAKQETSNAWWEGWRQAHRELQAYKVQVGDWYRVRRDDARFAVTRADHCDYVFVQRVRPKAGVRTTRIARKSLGPWSRSYELLTYSPPKSLEIEVATDPLATYVLTYIAKQPLGMRRRGKMFLIDIRYETGPLTPAAYRALAQHHQRVAPDSYVLLASPTTIRIDGKRIRELFPEIVAEPG